jgi:hypothetical protein
MEPEGSLPHSQVPATCLYPEPTQSSPYPNPISWKSILILSSHLCLGLPTSLFPSDFPTKTQFRDFVCECFVTKIRFHSEELLAPRPTPKLEEHLTSAVRDCLFNIFAATLHIGDRSSIRNLRTRHAVVTGTHLSMENTIPCIKLRSNCLITSCTLVPPKKYSQSWPNGYNSKSKRAKETKKSNTYPSENLTTPIN